MHVDSRNPERYNPWLSYIDGYNTYCAGMRTITIGEFVSYEDYKSLKAKLENLERKYAKLKRRYDNLGGKYLLVKLERDSMITEYTNHSELDYS